MTDFQSIATTARDHTAHQAPDTSFTPAPQEEASNVNTDDEGDEDETSEKKYTCPHCPHAFTRKHNLKSHLLIHTQEKPFSCTICSAKFRRLHDLKRHSKLHTGEKPHQCKSCGRKFARADALVRHNNSQAGCSVLIDDALIGEHQEDDDDERPYNESHTGSPVLTSKTIPQKRSFETSHWRIQMDSESPLPPAPDASTSKETTSREVLKTAISNITTTTTSPTTDTSTTGKEVARPPVRSHSQENAALLPYVRLLEARIETLEHKLSAAETKISHLTYAMTGQRPDGQA